MPISYSFEKNKLNEGFEIRNREFRKALKDEGLERIHLWQDNGYLFIWSDNPSETFYEDAIYVNKFKDQSIEQWIYDIKDIVNQNHVNESLVDYDEHLDDNDMEVNHHGFDDASLQMQMIGSKYITYEHNYKADYEKLVRLYYSHGVKFKVENVSQLQELIYQFCVTIGYDCDLNWIDTSAITNMSSLFNFSYKDNNQFDMTKFNAKIDQWDTSNVANMYGLFNYCRQFNQDISIWNTSNVKDMSCMFYRAESFNQNISNWDVSNVENMSHMFAETTFNRDISKWNTHNVKDMSCMFEASKFNQDISNWDVSKCESLYGMFYDSPFNKDISNWNVSKVENMKYTFAKSSFNQDISNWNVSNVGVIKHIFDECPMKEEYKPKRLRNEYN